MHIMLSLLYFSGVALICILIYKDPNLISGNHILIGCWTFIAL